MKIFWLSLDKADDKNTEYSSVFFNESLLRTYHSFCVFCFLFLLLLFFGVFFLSWLTLPNILLEMAGIEGLSLHKT